MKIFALGDIHGGLTAFERVLELANPQPDDLIVTLGDYIDRGPDSRGVIELLISLAQNGNLVSLRGNHELMMLAARGNMGVARDWLHYGGIETIESYRAETLADIPANHWQFLEEFCRDYFETEDFVFVHAGLDPNLPMEKQSESLLFWKKFAAPRHVSGKTTICGHTAQKSGLPFVTQHAICLDTWVYGEGWLSCLELGSGRLFQANQKGEARIGFLDDLAMEEV